MASGRVSRALENSSSASALAHSPGAYRPPVARCLRSQISPETMLWRRSVGPSLRLSGAGYIFIGRFGATESLQLYPFHPIDGCADDGVEKKICGEAPKGHPASPHPTCVSI